MSKYEIQLTASHNIDHDEWDAFVDSSPQGSIFCRLWWLEAVCPQGSEIILVRRGGRLAAAMPIVRDGGPTGGSIVMPPLTQTLGVLLAAPTAKKYERNLSEEMAVMKELIEGIPAFDQFAVRFHHRFTNWLPFYWRGYNQTTRYTYIIENTRDISSIFESFGHDARQNIRTAQREHVSAELSEDLEAFLAVNRKTFERQGMKPPYSDQFVRRLDAACRSHHGRAIILARDEQGRIHAGGYVVYDTRCMYLLMGGADPLFRSSGGQYLDKWRSIQLAGELGIPVDFEGSMMLNVESVYRSFGATQTPYFAISKDSRSLVRRCMARLRQKVSHMMQKVNLK